MSDELINIDEMIKESGLELTATRVPENPTMVSQNDKWYEDATHFHCVITCKDTGRTLTTYFSVGIGIVEHWARDKAPSHIRMVMRRKGPHRFGNGYTLDVWEALQKARDVFKPALRDVLECLASDASSVECESRFEDWADSLGYDTDSRRAEKIYNLCQNVGNDLRYLLGNGQYQKLLWETERL